ncbi:response regulator [Candidatus Saccharibacteria bacterium]|nr:response regulator [Candidatus Saccharibacteria bacterium]
MSKVMVVEDDASLREIYSIRITAEGYEVVSAGDGEEALAVAVREKPDLILSDVMMPKISGFDMLDILRSTPETASIKVVMMTALSSDDQRHRGEQLGADRYLVKSQVGIEDVVNTIHEVLGDRAAAPEPEPQPAPQPVQQPTPQPTPQPAAPQPAAPQPLPPQPQVQQPQPQQPQFQPQVANGQPTTPVQTQQPAAPTGTPAQ